MNGTAGPREMRQLAEWLDRVSELIEDYTWPGADLSPLADAMETGADLLDDAADKASDEIKARAA